MSLTFLNYSFSKMMMMDTLWLIFYAYMQFLDCSGRKFASRTALILCTGISSEPILCLRTDLRDGSVVYQHVFGTLLKMSLQLSCKQNCRVGSSVWIFSSVFQDLFGVHNLEINFDSSRVNLQPPLHYFLLSVVLDSRVNMYNNLIVFMFFG